VQTRGENLKVLQAKFDYRGEVTGSCYCKFSLRNLMKINKRQSAIHIDGIIVRWRVVLQKYCISETANSFVEVTVAFVEKVSKNTAVLQASSSKAIDNVRLYISTAGVESAPTKLCS